MALFDSAIVPLSKHCQKLVAVLKSGPGTSTYIDHIEKLWQVYQPFASAHFQRNFLTDESKFDSLMWEMILGVAFLEHGYQLQPSKSDNRPDLCIVLKGQKIWIECCLPRRGDPGNPNSVQEIPSDGEFHEVDPDKSVLRCTAKLAEKKAQHKKWIEDGVCIENEPFIIAINGHNLRLNIHDASLPDILRALYGLGDRYVTFDVKDLSHKESGYQFKPAIVKSGNAKVPRPIPTTFFLERDNNHISGVIYSTYWIGHCSSTPQYCYIENVNGRNRTGPIFGEFCQSYQYQQNQIKMLD